MRTYLRAVGVALVSLAFFSLAVSSCGGGGDGGGGGTGAPAAPSGLTVTRNGATVHLAWKDNSTNEMHFMVERKNGAAFQTLATVAANTETYDDTSTAAAIKQVYRVTAMSADGQTGSSGEASVAAAETSDLGAAPSDLAVSPDLAVVGSATCHAVGCRAFSSYCSTSPCKCLAIIDDNPDPDCAGTTVTCLADPCDGKTAACNHGTGKCVLQ